MIRSTIGILVGILGIGSFVLAGMLWGLRNDLPDDAGVLTLTSIGFAVLGLALVYGVLRATRQNKSAKTHPHERQLKRHGRVRRLL